MTVASLSYQDFQQLCAQQAKQIAQQTETIAQLREEVAELNALIRQLQAKLSTVNGIAFGTKSEAAPRLPKTGNHTRTRPVRRNYEHLPVEEKRITLSKEMTSCPACKKPLREMDDVVEGATLEIEVKAYRRVIRRQVMCRTCTCKNTPKFVKAPSPGKVVPKGSIGVSMWARLLMGKYAWHTPVERLLQQFASDGLDIAQPTVMDGFHRIHKLLKPAYEAICTFNRTESWWNSDETRWHRIGDQKQWLWVFLGQKSCVYKLANGRSAEILEEHLGDVEGVLHCDRFSAYKKYAKEKGVDLAFCWAHVRRDFVRLSKLKEHKEWAEGILVEIQEIFKLAADRFNAQGEEAFRSAVFDFLSKRQGEQAESDEIRGKALRSLEEHRQGLTTVCVDPQVSLDNNAAERALRGPVVGRKNYWGSKAVWSGELSVMMFSLIETAEMNEIDPQVWLIDYLTACAANKGKPPDDIGPWIPIASTNPRASPEAAA